MNVDVPASGAVVLCVEIDECKAGKTRPRGWRRIFSSIRSTYRFHLHRKHHWSSLYPEELISGPILEPNMVVMDSCFIGRVGYIYTWALDVCEKGPKKDSTSRCSPLDEHET